MSPKRWMLLILSSLALSSGVLYYSSLPSPDVGPIVVHHINKTHSLSAKIILTGLESTRTPSGVFLKPGEIPIPPFPTLYSGAIWTEATSTKLKQDFSYNYDNFNYEPNPAQRWQKIVQPPGRLWTSTFTVQTNIEDSKNESAFMKYYNDALKNTGWVSAVDIPELKISVAGPAADGPTGSLSGYVKVQGNKMRIIGLSENVSHFTNTSNEGPVEIQCPCDLNFEVFMSDEIDVSKFTN